MSSTLESIRKAFDTDCLVTKNIALRFAHAEIERLSAQIVGANEGVAEWLIRRAEAAEKDAAAHPEGHRNRDFYSAQAIAYENALSAVQGARKCGADRGTAGTSAEIPASAQ